jgi:hypothetical protein
LGDAPLLLCDLCSSVVHVKLSLVKMPKSLQDLEWFEQWSSEAPHWLQRIAEVALDGRDLAAFMDEAEDHTHAKCSGNKTSFLHWRGTGSASLPYPHPTKVLKAATVPSQTLQAKPIMTTGGEVLAAIRRTRLHLDSLNVRGRMVSLRWRNSLSAHVEREGTLEAVFAAIAAEPTVIFDPLWESSRMDIDEIVELAIAILAKHPGIYQQLPEYLHENRDVLFAAMAVDPNLKSDFLQTAGRNDVRQWHEWCRPSAVGASRCRWNARCRE